LPWTQHVYRCQNATCVSFHRLFPNATCVASCHHQCVFVVDDRQNETAAAIGYGYQTGTDGPADGLICCEIASLEVIVVVIAVEIASVIVVAISTVVTGCACVG